MTRISLVRHGLVANPDGVYYGRLQGFELAEKGRAQAVAAGRFLAHQGVTAIYHSPMLRAQQTALILQAHIQDSAPLIVSDLLNEIHSSYDGRSVAEMERIHWDFYYDISPPFEGPGDVLARMLAFFERMRDDHPGEHVIGVSHGDPIAFAILWAFSLPVTAEQRKRLTSCGVPEGYPAPASIATFTFDYNGRPEAIDFCYSCPSCDM
jgi:broad specificity phosphatase PhoE